MRVKRNVSYVPVFKHVHWRESQSDVLKKYFRFFFYSKMVTKTSLFSVIDMGKTSETSNHFPLFDILHNS